MTHTPDTQQELSHFKTCHDTCVDHLQRGFHRCCGCWTPNPLLCCLPASFAIYPRVQRRMQRQIKRPSADTLATNVQGSLVFDAMPLKKASREQYGRGSHFHLDGSIGGRREKQTSSNVTLTFPEVLLRILQT
jgi:hypothetical protein